jgi:hypothetical protein
MNANYAKAGSAILVINTLWFSRAFFNVRYFQPDVLSQYLPNGIFHLLPIPSNAFVFSLIVAVYFILGIAYIFSFQKYLLLGFFFAGSIVDNFQVNFVDGGHSRYLQYALLLHGVLALFLNVNSRKYLNSYRALIAAYYFTAGLYKVSAGGWAWGMDESIFVHAVAVQSSTPIKEFILSHFPELLRIGAYTVFLAEVMSPLILFFRPLRWFVVLTLFSFHLLFPIVWGGHGGFVVNCVCLLLCLSDEVWMRRLYEGLQNLSQKVRKAIPGHEF